MPSRSDVVEEARKWLGTPWRHQGRTSVGIDCVGLVINVANALGFIEYDTTSYDRRSSGLSLLEPFKEHMIEKSLKDVQEADVILFRDNAYPCHVAIASTRYGVLYMIHAYAVRRKVIEETFSPDWRNKALFCFEFPEITSGFTGATGVSS